ncbi:MAG: hypothetical protein V3U84_02405, partial [Thiotrichaceae bacterium]
MTNNDQITVSPEIPKSLLTPLELEILDGYGYRYEDDGYGSYQFTNDDGGAATLKVSIKALSDSENESAVKLHNIVKNMDINSEDGNYQINLGN